jgi:hypothetical protein
MPSVVENSIGQSFPARFTVLVWQKGGCFAEIPVLQLRYWFTLRCKHSF